MAKKLINMTWEEVQKEMSIAGNPKKIADLGEKLWSEIGAAVDFKNPAEILNIDLVLKRLQAEVKLAIRMYEERTGQKL